MKKILLLVVVALLPVFGFGQDPIVKWHGAQVNFTPTTNPTFYPGATSTSSQVSADNISGVGINFQYNSYNGFTGTGWPTATTPDLGKYFLLKVRPKAGYKIDATSLVINYKGNNKRMVVKYSKNDDFSSETTTTPITNLNPNNNNAVLTIPLSGVNTAILPGQTLYVRIYGYENTGTSWQLKDSPGNAYSDGPAIYGTITALPSSPIANNDAFNISHNSPTVISILTNDSQLTPSPTISITQLPTNGTVNLNGSNPVLYTPNTNFTGADTFKYTLTNANGTSNEATVTVNVAPRAVNDVVNTAHNTAATISVLGNDLYNTNIATPTITITQNPANGSLSMSGSNVIYTPNSGFSGTNTFQYTITNANGTSTAATVTINVATPLPIAVNDTANTGHNTATTINVLTNDNTNGIATTVNIVNGQGPANGTVSVNASTQVVTYTPASGFTGVNTFRYTLTNANGTSNQATVTVNVAPRAVNETVSAVQNVATTISVLANDVYATGSNPTVTITQNPANGTVSVNASNQVVFTSTGNYIGSNTFQYTITNVHGTSAVATVTVNIVPPPPVAKNDTATTLQNQAVTIPFLTNDTTNGFATTVQITQGLDGTATLNSNQIVFTPATGFLGDATFTYTLNNTNGTSNVATVTITVTAPIAPIAVADGYPVSMNVFTDLSVLANDDLGSATAVTSINATNPSHGTVSVNANNTIRYTPTNGYTGSDSFTYSIQTVYGVSSYVQVSLVVQPQTPTGPLCGEYYVGTGGHFTTLTQAVNYLNANGVSCPVTFLLTNTLYENVNANANGEIFPLTINSNINTTATNTVTFKPASGKKVIIRVNNVTVSNNLIHPLSLFKLMELTILFLME